MTLAEEISALKIRCLRIEQRINQIITSLSQVVSNQQVEALTIIFETDIDDLKSQIDECKVRLDILEQ